MEYRRPYRYEINDKNDKLLTIDDKLLFVLKMMLRIFLKILL
jgi:hypothetical protein